jgi:hypothetical protein
MVGALVPLDAWVGAAAAVLDAETAVPGAWLAGAEAAGGACVGAGTAERVAAGCAAAVALCAPPAVGAAEPLSAPAPHAAAAKTADTMISAVAARRNMIFIGFPILSEPEGHISAI